MLQTSTVTPISAPTVVACARVQALAFPTSYSLLRLFKEYRDVKQDLKQGGKIHIFPIFPPTA